MAKKAIAQNETAEERVEILIPRGQANDEPHLFLSVNGTNYLLPKGKYSLVPRSVAEEYYRCQRAQEALEHTVDALLEASSMRR